MALCSRSEAAWPQRASSACVGASFNMVSAGEGLPWTARNAALKVRRQAHLLQLFARRRKLPRERLVPVARAGPRRGERCLPVGEPELSPIFKEMRWLSCNVKPWLISRCSAAVPSCKESALEKMPFSRFWHKRIPKRCVFTSTPRQLPGTMPFRQCYMTFRYPVDSATSLLLTAIEQLAGERRQDRP
jgi:hypothetical protein